MATTLQIGENWIGTQPILDENGAALAVSSLASLQVQIKQYNRTLATYVLGTDDQIRVNPDVNTSFDVEISPALSANFREGSVQMYIKAQKTDTDFVVGEKYVDIDPVDILYMVL